MLWWWWLTTPPVVKYPPTTPPPVVAVTGVGVLSFVNTRGDASLAVALKDCLCGVCTALAAYRGPTLETFDSIDTS